MKLYPAQTGIISKRIPNSADVDLMIYRFSDGFWLDFSDMTYKNSGHVDDTGDMTADTNDVYKYSYTLPDAEEKYLVLIIDVTNGGLTYEYPEILEVMGATLFKVVSDVGNTATTFKTDRTETTTDKFKKPSLVKFLDGNVKWETVRLPASGSYNGTTKFITVDGAFSATPSANSRGIIINE